MPMTASQGGLAGEQQFSSCVTFTSDGELELFKPLTDDDHTDLSTGRRSHVPALAIQVKTILGLDRNGLGVARAYYSSGKPREHPAFIYAVVYIVDAAIECCWLLPSADFNRLTYRGAGPKGRGIELEFMASPVRDDRYSGYRWPRLEMGRHLLEIVDGVSGEVPRIAGAHVLLRRRHRRPARSHER